MLKKLSLLSIFILAIVFGFIFANKSHSAKAYGCQWINHTKIYCATDNTFRGDTGEDDYFFDPIASDRADYAIFDGGNDEATRFMHFSLGGVSKAYRSPNSNKITTDIDEIYSISVEKGWNALLESGNDVCGLLKTTDCQEQDEDWYSGPGYDATAMLANAAEAEDLENLQNACEKQAPLGFILCPIFGAVTDGISSLIGGQGVSGEREGLLISFLTFSPLNAPGKGGVDALPGIVGSIVALANSFYIIVFLILIFASSLPLGLDNYTIKKTLPKFIAAVILTQFSYLICGVIIDFFNLLGTIVPNMIFALPAGSGIEAGGGLSNIQKGLQTGIAVPLVGGFFIVFGWILIIIFALIALVAVIVGFVYMALRYLVLFVLILLAPIAFASWVLPGTEKFFSTWWKNFIKLNAMFPLITGMLAVSILLSQTLLASAEPNAAVKFIAMVIPVIALLMIPKTLKWTTQGMSALAGGMLGAVAGKMGAGGKAVSKGGKMAIDKGKKAGGAAIAEKRSQYAADQFGKGNKTRAALMAGRLPTQRGIQRTSQEATDYKEAVNKRSRAALSNVGASLQGIQSRDDVRGQLKSMGLEGHALDQQTQLVEAAFTANVDYNTGYDIYNHELQQIAGGGRSDLLGASGADGGMQIAAVSELASKGEFHRIVDAKAAPGSTLTNDKVMAGIQPHFSDAMAQAPDLIKGPEGAFNNISAEGITKLNAKTAERYVKLMQSRDGGTAGTNLTAQVARFAADPTLVARMDPKALAAINNGGIGVRII